MEQEKWLTLSDVAQKLSCDESMVQALIEGLPAAFHNKRGPIIHSDDLNIFLKIINSIIDHKKQPASNPIDVLQIKPRTFSKQDNERKLKKAKGLITGKEAAKTLNLFPGQVKDLIIQGELSGVIHARGCYVDPIGLEDYKKKTSQANQPIFNSGSVEKNKTQAEESREKNNTDLQKQNDCLDSSEKFEPRPSIDAVVNVEQKIPLEINKVITVKARKGETNDQKVCSLKDLALAADVSLLTVRRWIDDKKLQTVEISDNKLGLDNQRKETFVTIDSLRSFMAEYRQTRVTLIERVHFPEISKK